MEEEMNSMNQPRRGAKLLGLCVLALVLAAISAAGAQASATWMVKGESLLNTSENKAIKLKTTSIKLLATLGVNKTTFACTGGEFINGKLEPGGAVSEASKNAKIKLSGCTTEINGKIVKTCEPFIGSEKGVIVTNESYALLQLHKLTEVAKDGVVVITPKTGTTLAVINMGELCAFGEEVKVLGTLALKDAGGNAGLEEEKGATHTFEEFAPLTELTATNGGSKSKATIDGKLELELESKEAWSGLPDAKLRIESCMGEGTECKLASAGTTFTTSTESYVLESVGKEEAESEPATDECESTTSEEVVDPLSEGAGDNIEISVSKMEFSGCTTTPLEAVGLPWTASADLSSFAETHEMKWNQFLISTLWGCNYITSMAAGSTDVVFLKVDTSPNRSLDLGYLLYESGFLCYALKKINGTLLLLNISDPNLAGATSIIVR